MERNWFSNNIKLFIKPKQLFTLLLTVLIRFIDIQAAYYFALIAGFDISLFEFIPVISSAVIVGMLSGLPGGMGSREVAIGFLFTYIFNINIEITGVFSILNLFGTYLTFIIIGILGYIILKKKYKYQN